MQNNQKVLMLGGGTSNSMLLRLMASSTLVPVDDVTLSEFAVNDVEAALALSFTTNEYRTGNSETTFAEAFTGTSPKLTYSTAAGSNSTMVNSSGEIVWAPHNLLDYSEDFSDASWTKTGSTAIDSTLVTGPDGTLSGRRLLDFDSGTSDRLVGLATITNATVTCSLWVKGEGSNIGKDIQLKAKRFGGTFVQTTVLHTLTADWERIHATFTQDPSNTGARLALSNPVNGNEASEVLIYGAHVYRSDLGGMAQVPGAATGFEYYVPTNGNPEYLPRVGHHVYNGSTWVNEGLLIESEPRTNLVTHSEDFSQWSSTALEPLETGFTSPDGASNGTKIIPTTAGTAHYVSSGGVTVTNGVTYTFSFFAKKPETDGYRYVNTWASAWTDKTGQGPIFDLQTGLVENENGLECNMEDYGQGWYRCVVTGSVNNASLDLRIYPANVSTALPYAGDGTSGILIYGAQLDQGQVVNGTPVDAPTPSSYMPTYGNQFTRTAQSLTVPAHWYDADNPTYTGPDLVTEGSHTVIGSDWSYADGIYSSSGTTAGQNLLQFGDIGISDGQIYSVSLDIANRTSGTVGVKLFGGGLQFLSGNGTHTIFLTGTSSDGLQLSTHTNFNGDVSNISVRKVSAPQFGWNSDAVSLQMDGRMTYADTSQYSEVWFTRWYNGGANYLYQRLGTNSADTGRPTFDQRGISDVSGKVVSGDASAYSPGVLVPFNISSRHGSTFVNGAVDGVALTADTTPTALPDLSGTNLQIAYDFMGTIGTFRQFAGDIGDTGLVTATNPSTEPTLSLTFDGSEGSFYNLNWSE